ncbi:MAG: 1-phosphofructokinase family hexose kinase [Anaerolineae bacterium]
MPASPLDDNSREPVLTVTANTALDRCLLVPDFAFGRTVVAIDSVLAMAGKPADCSFVLAELGVSSVATGLAGGESGRTMVQMLEAAGVTCSFLWVDGETRVNVVIIQQGTGRQGTVTVPSLHPSYEDGERLFEHVRSLLPGRRWLVLGGSPPAGVADDLYPRLITAAREAGVRCLLDAGGKVLMASLAALPAIVKPNEIELGAALGRTLNTVDEVVEGARELCARGIELVIVTMGDSGSVCVSGEGAWHVPRVNVQALNTAGAGDAYGAGLLRGLLAGLPLPEALRWATATATSCVLNLGTAVCHRDDILRLLPQVQVIDVRRKE